MSASQNTLNGKEEEIDQKLNRLFESHTELKSEYAKLKSEYAELKSDHAELKCDHTKLKCDIVVQWERYLATTACENAEKAQDLAQLRTQLADQQRMFDEQLKTHVHEQVKAQMVQMQVKDRDVDDFEDMVRKNFKFFKNGPVLVPTFDGRFRMTYGKSMKETLGLEDKKITDTLKDLPYISITQMQSPKGPNTITYMALADIKD